MSDAPSPDVDADYLTYLDALVAAERTDLMVIGTADVAALIDRIRTLRRELAAADTSIATLSAADRYGEGLTRAARHIEQKAEWFGEGHQVTGHDLRRWAEQIRALEPDTAP